MARTRCVGSCVPVSVCLRRRKKTDFHFLLIHKLHLNSRRSGSVPPSALPTCPLGLFLQTSWTYRGDVCSSLTPPLPPLQNVVSREAVTWTRCSSTSFASPFASSAAVFLLRAFSVGCLRLRGSEPLAVLAVRLSSPGCLQTANPNPADLRPALTPASAFCFCTSGSFGWSSVLHPPPPAAAHLFLTSTA